MAKHFLVVLAIFVSSGIVCTKELHNNGGNLADIYDVQDHRSKRNVNTEEGVLVSPTAIPIFVNLEANVDDYFKEPDLPELSLFKRAPTGFMGMRGKKDFEPIGQMMGHRILYYNNKPSPNGKRAPTGFMGMRGKKSDTGHDRNLYDEPDEGTSEYVNRFYDLYNPDDEGNDDDYEPTNIWGWHTLEKRAKPGFFALRGKKLANNLYNYRLGFQNEFYKRAPTGFMGMRGRRSAEAFSQSRDNKRSSKAFFGVRGKREFSSDLSEWQEAKRSSMSRYIGVRGKKELLYTGRGKKEPFTFRNKFVGVRGKKTPEGLVLRPNTVIESNKRAPNGFIGMRGKKDMEMT